MASIQREAAARIPQQPQAQYSLDEQLATLVIAANKLGLYDAADYIARDIDDATYTWRALGLDA